jgi:hypothetical protein
MKLINKNVLTLLALSALLFTACKKVEVAKDAGSTGQVLIKIANADQNYALLNIDYVNTDQKLLLLDLRRDVANNTQLNQSVTVTIMLDTALLNKYNLDNGSNVLQLDGTLFSLVGATPTGTPGVWTVTFAPGEFAHPVYIDIPNAQLISLLSRNAIPFTMYVSNPADGARVGFDQRQVVVEIGAKNKYDGVYKITGGTNCGAYPSGMIDYTNPAFVGDYPLTWEVITTGQYTDDVYDNVRLGFPGHVFLNAGAGSYFGEMGLSLTFDPTTDAMTVSNYYGCPSPTRARCVVNDPAGINQFNAADHSIDASYWLVQAGVYRDHFCEHWEYIGPR